MKKIILILLCLMPVFVKADYSVTNYRIDITVLENGDVEVIEAFSMNGIYNGFERTINYKENYKGYQKDKLSSIENKSLYDAKSITIKEIRSIDFSNELYIDQLIENSYLFEKSTEASKGEYGVYTIDKTNSSEKYKIYNPSMMNKDFYINYTLNNITIVHEDISEIGMQLFENTDENIGYLEIFVHIPTNNELLKIWTHSENESISEIIDNQTIKIIVNNLEKNNSLDFRLVFDKDAITEVNKESEEFVLDKIIDIEKKFVNEEISKDTKYEILKEEVYNAVLKAENTNLKEDYENAVLMVNKLKEDDFKTELLVKLINLESKVERRYVFTKVIYTSVMGILLVGLILTFYQIYRKFDKKYTKYKNKYYKDIPSNYKPHIIGFLVRRKVNKQDLYASILNLITDKKISLEKTKNRKDYKLSKLSTENLSFSEERLMRFLFNREEQTTLDKIKKRARNHYNSFINKYSNWIDAATYEANSQDLYEDVLYFKIFGICYCLVSIVISALIIDKPTYFSPILVILIFIISIIYFISLYKRTPKGNEEYQKCKALERYINSNIFEKDDISKYLMYAMTFGCEDKLIKNMTYSNDNFNQLKVAIEDSLNISYSLKK